MRGVIVFLNLYEKHDTVTADIYYYITTELSYAKCYLRLAAYDATSFPNVLRFEFIKVCMGKNSNRHYGATSEYPATFLRP